MRSAVERARPPRSASLEKWLLGAIVLLALSLRVWAIDFGLPSMYHPDESMKVRIAQNMFKTGDLNPHYFKKPTLFIYLNALAYVPYYLVGRVTGRLESPDDIVPPTMLAMAVGRTPLPSTVLMGRLLSTLFATGSVVLISIVGRRISRRRLVGLLAALMLAVDPNHVANSRHVTENSYLVFLIVATLWASVCIFQRGKTSDYVAAGIAAGLAVSSKYNGVLVAMVPVIAHFLRAGAGGFRDTRIVLTLVLVPVAFFVTTPYALLDHEVFLRDMLPQVTHYATGHPGMEGNSLIWYLQYMGRTAGVIYVLAVLEIVRGLWKRCQRTVLLSIFPAVYLAFISGFVVRNNRTLLPATPFLFLLAASMLATLFERAQGLRSTGVRQTATAALIGLVAVALAQPIYRTAVRAIELKTVDGRETARVWIEENLPPGSKVALEAFSPFVDPARFSVQGYAYIIDHDPEWYVQNGFEYLIFSQGMYGAFFDNPARYPAQVALYNSFFDRFTLVRRFSDGGYEVRVYRVD